MDDTSGVNAVVTVDDLVHERDGIVLGEGSARRDHFGQISAVTEFCDDVGVVFGVIDVIDFYNVFAVFEKFEHLDLGGQQIFVDFSFDHAHIDDFDGNCLVWVDRCVLE